MIRKPKALEKFEQEADEGEENLGLNTAERSRQFYAVMRGLDENPNSDPTPEKIEEDRRYWEENKDLFPDPPRSGPRS